MLNVPATMLQQWKMGVNANVIDRSGRVFETDHRSAI
jgi:hypothetical protein